MSKHFILFLFCALQGVLALSPFRRELRAQDEAVINRIMSLPERDYYGILGLQPNVDTSQIRRAYVYLTRTVHPDKNPGISKCL